MENKAVELKKDEMIYNVGENEVKLSPSIVQKYLAKGNQQLTIGECAMFMNLCKHRNLNPFTNEAYIIKFGKEAAQMVVSKEAFMRKAEINPAYSGHEAGIIVSRGKDILELEGSFKLPTDTLLGGWAEVYVKDKEVSIKAKVSIAEYSKGQSTWKAIPCTMIRKVALVQALREAFPSDLGALYNAEELGVDESKVNNVKEEVEEVVQEQTATEKIKFEEVQEVIEVEQQDIEEVGF